MYTKLQYISQGQTVADHIANITSVLDLGCKWVQLRLKNVDTLAYIDAALVVRELCNEYSATFIINDNPQIALVSKADGVHLGLHDASISEARKVLGDSAIIGGTANTIADIQTHVQQKCDYIGLGPFRYTTTKEKLSPILGIEGYTQIMQEVNALQFSVPIYAIGGITVDDVDILMNTGIYGIAASGALTKQNSKIFISKII